jgi:Spy/CpxP family protein refolding chaperone
MSKKTIIIIVVILLGAFLIGWGIQRWLNPFSSSRSSELEVLSPSTKNQVANIQRRQGFRQMINILKLTNEQISDFSHIELAYRAETQIYIHQLDSIDLEILEEIKSENPDEEKLNVLTTSAGTIQSRLKKATVDHFLRIRALCTPQQRERFNEVITDIDKFRRGQGPGCGMRYGRKGRGRGRNR